MTKIKRITTDTGSNNNSQFLLEEKIKQYQEGVDYFVDETNSLYTIVSKKLKNEVWPNEYYPYDETVVLVDRSGWIKRMGFVSSKENPNEPNKKFIEKVKEGNFEQFIVNENENNQQKTETYQRLVSETKNEVNNLKDNKNPWLIWLFGASFLLVPFVFFLIFKKFVCLTRAKIIQR